MNEDTILFLEFLDLIDKNQLLSYFLCNEKCVCFHYLWYKFTMCIDYMIIVTIVKVRIIFISLWYVVLNK